MYSTPVKSWESVDVAGFGPYMLSGCEQERGNVGYKILSLARAKWKEIRYASDVGTQALTKKKIVTS